MREAIYFYSFDLLENDSGYKLRFLHIIPGSMIGFLRMKDAILNIYTHKAVALYRFRLENSV
jgi:hypothetical protein